MDMLPFCGWTASIDIAIKSGSAIRPNDDLTTIPTRRRIRIDHGIRAHVGSLSIGDIRVAALKTAAYVDVATAKIARYVDCRPVCQTYSIT